MAIALLALIFIAIIAWEVPGLVRKKMWREFAAFSVLLSALQAQLPGDGTESSPVQPRCSPWPL
jgi:hypothetical protein